jgi:hypothetical protein
MSHRHSQNRDDRESQRKRKSQTAVKLRATRAKGIVLGTSLVATGLILAFHHDKDLYSRVKREPIVSNRCKHALSAIDEHLSRWDIEFARTRIELAKGECASGAERVSLYHLERKLELTVTPDCQLALGDLERLLDEKKLRAAQGKIALARAECRSAAEKDLLSTQEEKLRREELGPI